MRCAHLSVCVQTALTEVPGPRENEKAIIDNLKDKDDGHALQYCTWHYQCTIILYLQISYTGISRAL